jgi:hypothetical protein
MKIIREERRKECVNKKKKKTKCRREEWRVNGEKL